MNVSETKQDLLARRDELQIRLNKIKADFERGLEADASERATELENAEVLNEIAKITDEELTKVDMEIAALDQ